MRNIYFGGSSSMAVAEQFLVLLASLAVLLSIIAIDVVLFYGTPLFAIFLWAGMAQLFIMALISGRFQKVTAIEWAIFIFMLFIFASCMWSVNLSVSFQQTYYYVLAFSMFVLASHGAKSRLALSALALAYVAGCLIAALIIIGKWRAGALFDSERLSLGTINANYMAYCIATAIPIMAALVELRVRFSSVLMPIIAFVFLMAIFMTGCRGALVAGGLALVYFYIVNMRKNLLYMIFFVVAGVMAWPYLYDSLSVGLQSRLNISLLVAGDSESFSGRLDVWPVAIQTFLDSPLIGAGIGVFKEMNYGGIGAHNFVLSLLAETGIVGLFVYLLLITLVFWRIIFHNKKIVLNSAVALLIVWLPIAMTGVWEAATAAWFVFGWFVAYAAYIRMGRHSGMVGHEV